MTVESENNEGDGIFVAFENSHFLDLHQINFSITFFPKQIYVRSLISIHLHRPSNWISMIGRMSPIIIAKGKKLL